MLLYSVETLKCLAWVPWLGCWLTVMVGILFYETEKFVDFWGGRCLGRDGTFGEILLFLATVLLRLIEGLLECR